LGGLLGGCAAPKAPHQTSSTRDGPFLTRLTSPSDSDSTTAGYEPDSGSSGHLTSPLGHPSQEFRSHGRSADGFVRMRQHGVQEGLLVRGASGGRWLVGPLLGRGGTAEVFEAVGEDLIAQLVKLLAKRPDRARRLPRPFAADAMCHGPGCRDCRRPLRLMVTDSGALHWVGQCACDDRRRCLVCGAVVTPGAELSDWTRFAFGSRYDRSVTRCPVAGAPAGGPAVDAGRRPVGPGPVGQVRRLTQADSGRAVAPARSRRSGRRVRVTPRDTRGRQGATPALLLSRELDTPAGYP
jgi:hypothetical protein